MLGLASDWLVIGKSTPSQKGRERDATRTDVQLCQFKIGLQSHTPGLQGTLFNT